MLARIEDSPALKEAVLREQGAHERRIAAYRRVKQAFIEHGSDAETIRRLREAEEIYEEWKNAHGELLEALGDLD